MYIVSMTIGERLKTAREKVARKSQGQAKRDIGVDITYLSKIENDKQLPTTWTLLRDLAKYYGVSTDYLLELSNDPRPHLSADRTLPTGDIDELMESYLQLPDDQRLLVLQLCRMMALQALDAEEREASSIYDKFQTALKRNDARAV